MVNEAYLWIISNLALATIFKGLIVIIIAVLTMLIGKKIIMAYFNRTVRHRKNVNKLRTVEKIILNIYKMVVLFIAIAIFLSDVLVVDTTSILTVAGISGLAVGMASQTIIKDFVSGIMLLLEDTITIGDDVEIGAKRGRVIDINLRAIVLKDGDVLHVVPNNTITVFSNYTRCKVEGDNDEG